MLPVSHDQGCPSSVLLKLLFLGGGVGVTELTVSYLAEAEDISDILSNRVHFF